MPMQHFFGAGHGTTFKIKNDNEASAILSNSDEHNSLTLSRSITYATLRFT